MSDAQVIEQVLEGDTGAFEILILKYQSQIFYSAMNIVKNKEYAEDICQDAFLKAYEKLDTLQDKEHFYPWLKRIAVNLSLNHYERDKRIVDMEDEESDVDYFERLTTGECPEDYIIKDELKKYVVTAQNLEPNTELKYTFEKDEEGEEYSLVAYQNIEEIVLAVKEVGSDSVAKELTEITVSPDQYTWYIRDYVGRNLAFCGYTSMGGEYRDAYGASTIVFVLMPDDGTYIEPDDEETIKQYVVTGQSVAPNSELKLELMSDENGEEYGNLVESQNIQEIELYLSPVVE